MSPALIHPETAITDPTERSIPASRITKVIPHARNKLIVICLTTLNRFVTVAKLLVVKLNTTQRITSPARIPILDLIVCITDKFFQFLFSIIVTLFPLSQTP